MEPNIQSKLTAGVFLSIGLLPSVHLVALQLATLLIIVSVALEWRHFRSRIRLSWPHWAILLFILYGTINVLTYESLPGNRHHYFKIALETWFITLGAFFVTLAFSHSRDLHAAALTWLPVGLGLSFLIMSFFFFSRIEGYRPDAFAPSALYPPLWFLILTGISFCWYDSMGQAQKTTRFALLGLSGLMALYAGARLILIAWILLSIYLLYYVSAGHSTVSATRRLGLIMLGVLCAVLTISGLDILFNGPWALTYRFTGSIQALLQQEKEFLRFQLWSESWRLISEHPWLGFGQINERFILREIGPEKWWYRAHQTYLSFWLSGGIIGLGFGLLFQLTALSLISPVYKRSLAPAVVALLGITFLNGLTDSIFQSFFSLQVYMLLVILFSPKRQARVV